MSEIERILDDLPSQLRHQGELEELKDYARFLEQQNKRYRDLLKEIKSDIKTDYTDSEIENMPLLNVIIEQINKALEGDSDE